MLLLRRSSMDSFPSSSVRLLRRCCLISERVPPFVIVVGSLRKNSVSCRLKIPSSVTLSLVQDLTSFSIRISKLECFLFAYRSLMLLMLMASVHVLLLVRISWSWRRG